MKRQERAREIEIEEKINKEKMFEYSKVEITHTYFNEAFHLEILIQNWKKKKKTDVGLTKLRSHPADLGDFCRLTCNWNTTLDEFSFTFYKTAMHNFPSPVSRRRLSPKDNITRPAMRREHNLLGGNKGPQNKRNGKKTLRTTPHDIHTLPLRWGETVCRGTEAAELMGESQKQYMPTRKKNCGKKITSCRVHHGDFTDKCFGE